MKKTAWAAVLVLVLTAWATASERRSADVARIESASVVLRQIMSAPDSAIPDGIMNGAKCVAIVPSDLKAGFIFGANYGKGVATCRTEHGWSAPVFFKMTGGSFGFQAGGQASDLVLIVRTEQGMQRLLQSKFKLGADASAAAGPVGRDAQAMTDLTLRAQILTYSRSRGLFLGVSLGGAVVHQDQADTQAFYGKDWTFYSLLNGEVPATADSKVLLNTVERYAPTPRAHASAAPAPASTGPADQPAAQPVPAEEPATKPAAEAPTTGSSAASAPVAENSTGYSSSSNQR